MLLVDSVVLMDSRPVLFTQENKDRIGLGFFHLVLWTPPDQEKLKILQFLIIRFGDQTGTERAPKAHARVQFCSNPVRSDALFS